MASDLGYITWRKECIVVLEATRDKGFYYIPKFSKYQKAIRSCCLLQVVKRRNLDLRKISLYYKSSFARNELHNPMWCLKRAPMYEVLSDM